MNWAVQHHVLEDSQKGLEGLYSTEVSSDRCLPYCSFRGDTHVTPIVASHIEFIFVAVPWIKNGVLLRYLHYLDSIHPIIHR